MHKVLITGAASGLGKELALRYAKQGAEICVVDLNAHEGNSIASLIQSTGGNAFFQACDITKQEDVEQLFERVNQHWGSLDILINNAGVATAGLVPFESLQDWQWVIDINLLGHVRMTKAFLPLIEKSNAEFRAIVNIASQAGITPSPGMGSYCASKAAMVSFSETLYFEQVHNGVHVSAVCPAFFDTNLNNSLRTNQPGMQNAVTKLLKNSGVTAEEIAEKIVTQVAAKEFLILTHNESRKAHLLKRFLPLSWYLKMVAKQTAKYTKPRVQGSD
ncbi:MAG: SDR family oxidoreductase [Acidiferrobacterales bacterium]|nr:SDR family oxidoreductase [Acidiferrobacterales bacterium]